MRSNYSFKLIRSAAFLTGAATIAFNAAAIEPAEVKLGESGISFIPTIQIKQGYDDNVFATTFDEKSSGKLEIIPDLKLQAHRQDSQYTLGLGLNSATYYDVSDADYVNWDLYGEINEVFNSRNRLDVNLEVGTYSEDKSFELQDELPEYDGVKAGILYGFGAKSAMFSFDLFADYEEKTYSSQVDQSRDSENVKAGGTAYVAVAPSTKALLEVNNSDIGYTNDPESDVEVFTGYVGVTWEATAKTTGTVKVGQQKQERVDGDSTTDPSWEIEVSWAPKSYSTFNFNTAQTFGLDSQSGDYTQYMDVGADWAHDWSPLWSTKLFVSYKDEDLLAGTDGRGAGFEVGTTLITRETVGFGFDVTYDINRWAELTGGYELTDRTADAEASTPNATSDEYKRNYFYVGIELSL